ncbi:MAG: hypothetical protein PHR37_07275, partial [Eubacteriales bacterium]|nr:hypothetical protein [Eubacteriales bacterium]
MKLSNQMIENRLKRAVEATVPNVLPDLLLNIEKKEACKMNTNTRDEVTYKKKTHSGRWFKTLASVAAVAVLVFGVWFGLTNYSTEAVVAFDVNPSIELSVNRAEKVIRVNSRNSAAHEVVGDMDLKGVKLEVAVNALVGSMVQKGYISELNNSILITVNSNNAEKGEQLQDRLTASVSSLLTSLSVDGAIMTQTNSDSADELAQVYGISRGKAALIEKVVAEDSTLEYEDLVDLSINDLNLLIESRQPQMIQVRTSGQASDKGYIGTDRAKQIAFAHAGIAAADVRDLEVELDSNNGQMIYEVEFYANGFEYEYHIEAENGYIFEIGKDDDDDDDDKAQSTIRETSRATSQEGTKETERATERETVKSSERATSQETVKETERATERVHVTTAQQPSAYTKATSQETVKETERATERVHSTTTQQPASRERLSAAGAR